MTTLDTLRDYPANLPGIIDLGHRHYAMSVDHGAWYIWWHDCPKVEHVSWNWIGEQTTTTEEPTARSTTRSGHVIERREPLTIRGSLVCTTCRDHGSIENGRWRPL